MNTKALKAKILDLAIHGKLVPQNPEHESAEKLLEKIRAEKEEKIAKGELKRDKKDSYIFVGDDKRHYEKFADGTVKDIEDEIPFEVPEGWAWCRLKEIALKLVDGDHNPPKGIPEVTDYKMLSSRNINQNSIVDLNSVRYLTKELFEEENKRTQLTTGDILFTSVGSLGRSCLFDGTGNYCFQRSVTVINTNQYNPFIKYYFDSRYYQKVILDNATGTAQLGFYLEQMSKSLIVLPPLQMQIMITSKLETIFSQIDSLETDKADLQTAIKHAKSKILDLAIHGKLVPQDPSEEPASKLLERIRAEKEAKIAAGKLKRDKNDSYIYKNPSDNCHYRKYIDGHEEYVEDEFYRNIPVNWCLCNLGELCLEIKRGKSPKYTDKSNYLVFAQKCNQKYGPTSLEKALYLDESTLKKYPPSEFMQFDDIVINSTGTGTMGRVGIFKNTLPYDIKGIVPDSHVTVIRTMRNIDQNYIYAFLKLNQGKLEGFGEGSTNQKELKPLTISELITPLPPAEEQKRIVSKIEEIFGILDTISKNLE